MSSGNALAVSTIAIICSGIFVLLTFISLQYRLSIRRASTKKKRLDLPHPKNLRREEISSCLRSLRIRYAPSLPLCADFDPRTGLVSTGTGPEGIFFNRRTGVTTDLRREVADYWRLMVGAAEQAGVGQKEGESVAEFIERIGLLVDLSPQRIAILTWGHDRAMYSATPWTHSEVSEYQAAIGDLRGRLQNIFEH